MKAISIDRNNGVTIVRFDLPEKSMNILSAEVLDEIRATFTELQKDENVKGVVFISGKEDSFIAGLDVSSIEAVSDSQVGMEKATEGQAVFNIIADMSVPVVCAINGICLGGGTELALACDFRISTDNPDSKIGLPEVLLGIIPGFGGSQRLPRLVGLQTALDMILTGKNYDSKKALNSGLVDMIVSREALLEEAIKLAIRGSEGKTGDLIRIRKRKRGGFRNFLLEKNPIGKNIVFNTARKKVLRQSGGNYPAPLKAIEAIKTGIGVSLKDGLQIEARLVGELIVTDVSKNLINVFYLKENAKKLSVAAEKVPQINKTAVVGAGIMGGGIAQLLAHKDIPVIMKDINQKALDLGISSAQKIFNSSVKHGRLTENGYNRKMSYLTPTLEFDGFEDIDIVIEAVVEKMEVKKSVIKEVSEIVRVDAIIASNTSSLSISEMATVAKTPENVIGLHFFNPVHKMPLVEVIRGKKSSNRSLEITLNLATHIGKTPIIVKDSPGFLVNRILAVYLNEAGYLFKGGADVRRIDKIIKSFGMPMGPFRLLDEIGFDIAMHASNVLSNAFPQRLVQSTLIEELRDIGLLGKKGGIGFYTYGGKRETVNTNINDFREKHDFQHDAELIIKRLIWPMISEAALCLDEGIIDSPQVVDTGMIFGSGFPPFRGGLLRYADSVGNAVVWNGLNSLAERFGSRLSPADSLKEDKSFYN
ncbi:MAG: enoyl-CoA hydratase/isomerase family protein [Candidatus Marinimicrobia bacterium]|nr:enoyl-CoA hydratase/isomerase family protein [Candidatus Neomarinimicrobiota bacterium]